MQNIGCMPGKVTISAQGRHQEGVSLPNLRHLTHNAEFQVGIESLKFVTKTVLPQRSVSWHLDSGVGLDPLSFPAKIMNAFSPLRNRFNATAELCDKLSETSVDHLAVMNGLK